MDSNDWVLLSDDGFLDGDENLIFPGKSNSESKSVLDMNYFCKSPKSRASATQLLHDPIQSEAKIGEENTDQEDHDGDPATPVIIAPKVEGADMEADKHSVSVSELFSQLENKFADMKMDSPKSSPRGLFLFPASLDDAGGLKFEEQGEAITSPRMKGEKDMVVMDCVKEEEDTSGGFNFWKWSLTGVGAICSFGVAATICVLFLGSKQRNKLHQGHHKIQFQICTDDKRIKQVVQQATKLNEAIAATRGIPLSRAHITYGGYYEGL